uniref:Xylulose kinase-1 n=1 Tax=Tanacetum cinerariifolium TaxID=118510 RepID=A0A699HBW9_TANCI|nr:hypothetical protein [Tanacetum cinerariifolium]
MSTPKFIDVHNLVVFLCKPTESKGIEQIIDFLNAKNINEEAQIHAKVDGKKVIISETTIKRDLKFEDEGRVDCFSNEVIFEQLTLMRHGEGSTTPSAPQHTPIILPSTSKPQKKQKPRKSKNKDTQETQPSDPTYEALNEKNVPAQSNDPPFSRVNTLGSREDRLKLKELMEICTKLQQKVFDLENTMTVQAQKISSLKKRVKRLEKKRRLRNHRLKRLYKVGLSARVESSAEEQSLDDEEVVVEKAIAVKEVDDAQDQVSAATTTVAKDLTIDDITLAKALEALKTSKPKIRRIVVRDHKEPSKSTTIPTSIVDSTRPKAKGIVMEEPSEATTTTIPIPSNLQDKDKGIMVEPEMPLKKKAQINAEKAKLFMEFLEKRRKFFAAKRAEEKRNRPLTKAQQRSLMCTYLKNMDGWKPRALKNKSFAEIKELFNKEMTRINNFVDFRTELVKESSKKAEESSSKRAGDELEQESAKSIR